MKRPTASARSRQNGTYQLLTRPTPDHGAGCPDSYHETQPRVCLRDQCLVTDTAGVQPRTIASRRRTSNLGFWVFSGPLTVPLHDKRQPASRTWLLRPRRAANVHSAIPRDRADAEGAAPDRGASAHGPVIGWLVALVIPRVTGESLTTSGALERPVGWRLARVSRQ